MPLWTFYAYIGMRGAKIPILTIDRFPNDWVEMKELLRDAARTAYNEYGTIEATWVLERHVSTKVKVWRPTIGSYVFKPFSFKREGEAHFRIVYIAVADEIEVKTAVFAPNNQAVAREFKELERDVKYLVEPLIPKTYKSFLENPRVLLQEFSVLRYPDYIRTVKLKYDKPRGKRRDAHLRTYLPWGERIRESK
jgi:hypothetical protein